MAKYINRSTGYELNNSSMIDSRFASSSLATERKTAITKRYKGLHVFIEDIDKDYWYRDGTDDTDFVEYCPNGPLNLVTSIYNDTTILNNIPDEYERFGIEVFIRQNALVGTVTDWIYSSSEEDWIPDETPYADNPTGSHIEADVVFCDAASFVVTGGKLTSPAFPDADTNKDLVVVALRPWLSTRTITRFRWVNNEWVVETTKYSGIRTLAYEESKARLNKQNGFTCCVVNIGIEDEDDPSVPVTVNEYRFTANGWSPVTSAPSGPSGPMIVEVDENATPAQVKTAIGNAFSSAGISPIPAGQEANVVFKTQNDVPVKISKYIYLSDWEIMSGTQEVRFTIPASGNVASDNADVSISESSNHTIVTIPHNFSTQYIDVSIYDDSDNDATRGPKVYAATECVELPNDAGFAVEITFDQTQASLGGSKFIAVFQK